MVMGANLRISDFRLRRRAARALRRAAAVDSVVALRRHPAAERRGPGRALSGPRHCPRPGARRQQRQPVAPLQARRGPRPEGRASNIVHIGAGAGYYGAILAELVGSSGEVTAVEFDAALAERAKTFLSGRSNVRIVHGDGARWPETSADGVYVNFAVSRPADCWIEGLAPGGRLAFRSASPVSSGRIPAPGIATAALRSGSNGAATPTRRAQSALPILSAPKENSRLIPKR
jgi:SAM-dependent methyltransferase